MDIAKLEAQFASLKTEAETLLSADTVSVEDAAKAEANFASMNDINKRIEAYKKLDVAFAGGTPVKKDAAKFEAIKSADKAEYDFANFSRDASAYFRDEQTSVEFATISTSTGSGLFVPREVTKPIQDSLGNAYRVGILAAGGVVPTDPTTSQKVTPIVDMGAGDVVPENEADNAAIATNEPDIGTNKLKFDYKSYGSNPVYVTRDELAALPFDFMSELMPELYDAKEQGLEKAITTFVKGLSGTASVTLAAGNAVTYAKLQQARRAGKKRYDRMKFMAVHSDFYSAMEGLTDTAGRPVLVQDPQNQNLQRFLGLPIVRCDFFDTFGAANNVIGAVISCRGFKLRDHSEVYMPNYRNLPNKRSKFGTEYIQSHAYDAVADSVTLIKASA